MNQTPTVNAAWRAAILIVAAGLLAGCAVVQSQSLSHRAAHVLGEGGGHKTQRAQRGLIYYLPQRKMKITASRNVKKTEGVQKAEKAVADAKKKLEAEQKKKKAADAQIKVLEQQISLASANPVLGSQQELLQKELEKQQLEARKADNAIPALESTLVEARRLLQAALGPVDKLDSQAG